MKVKNAPSNLFSGNFQSPQMFTKRSVKLNHIRILFSTSCNVHGSSNSQDRTIVGPLATNWSHTSVNQHRIWNQKVLELSAKRRLFETFEIQFQGLRNISGTYRETSNEIINVNFNICDRKQQKLKILGLIKFM